MNLIQLRTEVLDSGFDFSQYGTRINGWLNDAQNDLARTVDFYVDEAVQQITTVAGTQTYSLPADFARGRDLFDTTVNRSLESVSLRDIDNSPASQGRPWCYAFGSGALLTLYPTPDSAYVLDYRYWKLPPALVADGDVPSIPADYHSMLVLFALGRAFERDDDPQQAQYYWQQWEQSKRKFAADLRFPTSEEPHVVRGMWDRGTPLGRPGWSMFGV